jgi:hypothetical protein
VAAAKRQERAPEAVHEIEQAVYLRKPWGLEPHLFCSCGFAASGDNWEEAGEGYDAHLAESSDS